MIDTIVSTVVALWNAIPSLVDAFLYAAWQGVLSGVNWIWTTLLGYSSDLISPSWTLDLSGVMPYVDAITYFFPVYQTLVFVAATYTAVLSIRALRWLLACIPTLNLG